MTSKIPCLFILPYFLDFIFFFLWGHMYPRLASNYLYSLRWPWTNDPLASASEVWDWRHEPFHPVYANIELRALNTLDKSSTTASHFQPPFYLFKTARKHVQHAPLTLVLGFPFSKYRLDHKDQTVLSPSREAHRMPNRRAARTSIQGGAAVCFYTFSSL